MSLHNFLSHKSYIDMDYVYGVLSNTGGENPLDYEALAANPAAFIAVAANAETGQVKYFDKGDMALDHYDILKASCSIPLVCRPCFIGGVPYYDGALSDPVPIAKAFSLGCEKVVLILTKPRDFLRTPGKDKRLSALIRRKYPLAAAQLEQRAARYNTSIALAKEYEQQGKLLIVAPDDTCGMDTLTRSPEAMKRFYEKGMHDGRRIASFCK